MSCGVGRRRGLDLAWLWLPPAVAAPISPLAWEPPYAADGALKSKQTNKTKKPEVLSLGGSVSSNPEKIAPRICREFCNKRSDSPNEISLLIKEN